jgi:hypothetical protein
LATATLADLKAFLAVKASQLVVVHACSLATRQDVQAAVAETPPLGGKLSQAAA